MGWAFRHSPLTGAHFQIHLAIADSVNDQHGNELWMSQVNLAKKARTTAKTAHAALEAMLSLGLLEEASGSSGEHGGKKVRHFVFLFPELPVVYESRTRPSPNKNPGLIGKDDQSVTRDAPIGTQDRSNRYSGRINPIEPKEQPNRTRKKNEAWDALVAVLLWKPSGLTRSESTRLGKTLREITAALPEETSPEDIGKHITARALRYRAAWPTAELTPESLVKHWSRFGPQAHQPQQTGQPKPGARLTDEERSIREGRIKGREHWLREAFKDPSLAEYVPPPEPEDAEYWATHGDDWKHALAWETA